jgi:hypothetical protein
MPTRSGQATFPYKLTYNYITTHWTDLFQHVKYISRILENMIFCQSFVWKSRDSFQYPSPAAYGCHLCMAFSKTFRITKTFHVAMLQRYKGFWNSGPQPPTNLQSLRSSLIIPKILNWCFLLK